MQETIFLEWNTQTQSEPLKASRKLGKTYRSKETTDPRSGCMRQNY